MLAYTSNVFVAILHTHVSASVAHHMQCADKLIFVRSIKHHIPTPMWKVKGLLKDCSKRGEDQAAAHMHVMHQKEVACIVLSITVHTVANCI